MPIQIDVSGKNKDYTPAPRGTHQAVCCDVVDLGVVESNFNGETKLRDMVRVVWQIAERMDGGKRFSVGKRYTASLHERAALRKDIEEWLERKLTPEDLQALAEGLEDFLIGRNAILRITHDERTGTDGTLRTYANITTIMPYEGQEPMEPEDYLRACERDDWQEPKHVRDGNGGSNGTGAAGSNPSHSTASVAAATQSRAVTPATMNLASGAAVDELIEQSAELLGTAKGMKKLDELVHQATRGERDLRTLTVDDVAHVRQLLRQIKPTEAVMSKAATPASTGGTVDDSIFDDESEPGYIADSKERERILADGATDAAGKGKSRKAQPALVEAQAGSSYPAN